MDELEKERVLQPIIRQIQIAARDASIVRELLQYLLSLPWKDIYEEEGRELERAAKEHQEKVDKGAGYCKWCDKFEDRLYYGRFIVPPIPSGLDPFTKAYLTRRSLSPATYEGNCCYKCYNKFQIDYVDRGDQVARCDTCLDLFPLDAIHKYSPGNQYFRKGSHGYWYCNDCIIPKREKDTIQCKICREYAFEYINSYCVNCYRKEPSSSAVYHELSRARKRGLEATLTLEQWTKTVQYFKYKCAYCMEYPYAAMEHYLGIPLGGGTIAKNCIPSCDACNSKKGGNPPGELDRLFPKENLTRIREYLSQQPS